MRRLHVISLTTAVVTLLGGQILVPAATSARPSPTRPPAASPEEAAERALRAGSSAPVTVRRDRAGAARSVSTKAGHPVARPPG
ncbi:MAG: hypothetical protein ACRDV2_16110, partial [Actinomycetes bacterium]